jgi:hypothetical protein
VKIKIPVSAGELVDKITILKIKKKNVIDQNKKVNIDRELDFLTDIYNEINNEKKLDSFLNKLLEVNQKLWEIEDEIRVLERKKQFDEDFILLARSVYIENDKRFEIKNEINNFLGSAIKEEKLYEDYN